MSATPVVFAHLLAMTDDIGLFEHAKLDRPRPHHGYCVDDVARGLVVLSREEVSDDPELNRVAWLYLRFIDRSQTDDGRVINRCDTQGVLHGSATTEDCWGRALWGLGAATCHPDAALAAKAMVQFSLSARQRSQWPKAMAFAALGAAEALRADPAHPDALELLADAVTVIGRPGPDPSWPWPEPRLSYANAAIPEVLLAAGDALDDGTLIDDGLTLLAWLLDVESAGYHLSPSPTRGWGLGEPRPAFDQQPIEVATLADACARAFELTGETRWSEGVKRAAAWFLGANDIGRPMYDPVTGGCCDGLKAAGRNENQGAESTLAALTTLQHAQRLVHPLAQSLAPSPAHPLTVDGLRTAG